MKVVMYTDGAAKGNPGPGGFGTVLLAGENHEFRKEISAGYRKTTNNRMELLAVIRGLEALKKPGMEVIIYSDSKYVVDAVTKGWLKSWLMKGFKGKKNEDLWRRFAELAQHHKVYLQWVKGHAGNRENERCDTLAVAAAEKKNLPPDVFYEQNS